MEHLLILSIILATLILFASEIVRADVIAIGVAVVLMASGIVNYEVGFSGFSNPAVITVIAMFILSSGLVKTGVADYMGELMIKIGGTSPFYLTVVVMAFVGAMSAFMNNIGATAILLTSVFAVARKAEYDSAKLLMPLSFGSLLGGLMTLVGTPPNLLVSAALTDYDFEGFRMFDFLPTGLAVMAVGTLYMAFVGRFLIPSRKKADDISASYKLEDYITEISLSENSSFAGKTIKDSGMHDEYKLTVLKISRKKADKTINVNPTPDTMLYPKDRLLVKGNIDKLLQVKEGADLEIHIEKKVKDDHLTGENVQLAEVAIAPNAGIVGQSIKQADIRRRYGVLAIALHRRGHVFRRNYATVPLDVGDVILVQGTPDSLSMLAKNQDFLVVNRLEHEPRKTHKAPYAIASMLVAVILAATGTFHISLAGFIGVILMVMFKCIKPVDLYKDVNWQVIFLIAGMMPLGIAMDDNHTGTASWIAEHIVTIAGDHGPLFVMGALFFITSFFTAVMSNAATAVLLAPIAISISTGMGIQPYPFLMTIAISASSSFLTPIGHQANVLIYGLGGFKFLDFARVGAPLTIIIFIVTMLVVPWVWPFEPL